ncbi:MAG TPA: endonuclease/exonuclease/phosphatase family protein, partial [Acidimicrobiales bacterium]
PPSGATEPVATEPVSTVPGERADPGDGPATLRVASFNVHMGVDGWGRPFDLVAECAALDADVLILQEAWTPDDGTPGTAALVAGRLGYHVVAEADLAHARLYAPVATDTGRWAPLLGQVRKTLRLDDERFTVPAGSRDRASVSGRWGVALLARVPCRDAEVLSLGKLRRDPASRAVIRCTTALGGAELTVHGTHMSHITHLSPAQYRRLARLLPPLDRPGVLAGDMNMWGPPASSFFRGWRRAVVGRTWPAHRPHSQLDHVLVTPALRVVDARVADGTGSDHRPVVVTLALA